MKRIRKILSLLSVGVLLTMCCVSCDKSGSTSQAPTVPNPTAADKNPDNYIPITKMNLSSTGIKDGIIDPQYGAASTDKIGAMPLESIPLEWSGAPSSAKAYAITIIDYDTVPIMGFPWIHWVTTNIDAGTTSLPANASTTMEKDMIQGVNSYANGFPLDLTSLKGFQVPREKAYHYGGMVPVNFPHKYTMTVYALNENLDLKIGFGLNDLYNAMEGHIVGQGVTYGTYNAKIAKV
ncbi:YbhB/YbcL family Raf kinase inhibitor-like protein [uncultured Clostridium sp.]|uniref:YbhB/YbcL family Raf kinase inhibitor-like protein n=1 Tax=uncultured Clostridium sp. TaxID=59620 RepID=UPI0026058BCF|nr:YbhB/YbcL family Raf kinase inhibitor-like protein [uncultured Clostridium sp.]